MQSTSVLRRTAAPAVPRFAWPKITEGRTIFWLALFLYAAVALVLVFGLNIIQGDALSRVGNAEYVLYSRDPHLAAIGFVWNPLPSLLMMPLLPLKVLFPELVERGFASNIVSCVFMAGAVYQLWATLAELGLRRAWRLLLTVLFGLHPMIVFYGANGMSEAPFLFFLILSTRCLAAWLATSRLEWQVYTGLSLGAAYLCRYEALPAGLGALAVVAIVSWTRAAKNSEQRFATAFCDTAIVAAPFLLAVGVWAVASFVIVGHPFEQFSSIYGNGSQMRTLSFQHNLDAAISGVTQVLALEPLVLAVFGLGLWNAIKQRDVRVLAVLAVLFPVLGFAAWAHMTGAVAPWIRYFIVVIPLSSLIAAFAIDSSVPGEVSTWRLPGWTMLVTPAGLMLAAVLAGIVMTNPTIAPEEGHELAFLTSGSSRTADEERAANRFVTERAIAAAVDGLKLPRGSVLVDTFIGFPIVLSSKNPDQFVITSDRNFKQALADPAGTGVRYLLVPRPSALGQLDAVNQGYPGIFDSGAGIATLVEDFRNVGDGSDWRLYRVIGGASR